MMGPGAYLFTRSALLVVDGPQDSDALKEALARTGYQADVCSSAGLVGRATEGYEFLVLDGGLDAVCRLRSRGVRLPVILLSSEVAPAPVEGGLGVVERLSNLFTLGVLRRTIAKISGADPPEPGVPPGKG